MAKKQTRRQYVLALGAVGVAGLAGCSESDSADGTPTMATEPDPTDTVTNILQPTDTVGIVDGESVSTVEITVQRAPDNEDIDLSQTTVVWDDSTGSYNLTSESSSSGDGSFTVTSVEDDDESIAGDSTLNADGDRAMLTIDLTALGGALDAGASATVSLTTPSGGSTEIRLVVPENLSGQDTVGL